MADVNVTVYPINRTTGVDYTTNLLAVTSANTYYIPNDGTVRLMLECTAGGTATIDTPNTVDGLAIANLTLTLTAAKVFIFGVFPVAVYGSSIKLTVSANSNLLAVRG
jgi:hypothetical protein